MSLKYRPEIDGLRALAVISVIFYHAELIVFRGHNVFQGGFIGVDIFFVISGYLISLIILKELSANSFSFSSFYERRARRILPALFVVTFASIPFAWLYMLPKALKEYAGSILSSLFFGSNIWFWQEDAYTAEPSAFKPFLHTWSLSVEEQFYLFFPVVLILIWKYVRRYLSSLLLLGFFVSLQLSHAFSMNSSSANFYLLPTRGWELLAGAILAQFEIKKGRSNSSVLNVVAPIAGLFLIVYSILFYDHHLRHPSWNTVPPIVGCMLIIWFCQKGGLVTRVLSLKPMVLVGLISYSLYLWHFPILVFSRIKEVEASNYAKWEHLVLAVVLACLTYMFVEKPTRDKKRMSIKLFSCVMTVAFVGLIGSHLFFYKSDGAKFRLSEYESLFQTGQLNSKIGGRNCFRPTPKLGEHCQFTVPNATGTLVGLGDSHLEVFSESLYDLAQRRNMNYIQLPDCVWILNSEELRTDGERRSNSCPEAQLEELSKLTNVVVVNSQRITLRMTGLFPEGVFEGRKYHQFVVAENNPDNIKSIEQAVALGNQKILNMGHTLVQIFPIPEKVFSVPKRYRKLLQGADQFQYEEVIKNADITSSYDAYKERHKHTFKTLESINNSQYIKIYPDKLFCSEETKKCRTEMNANLLYMDTDHLSKYAADLVVREIEKKLFN